MNNLSILKTALKMFKSNKVRTALTVLGIMIGIASIIVVFSAGQGIENMLSTQMAMFGPDTIQTEIKIPSSKKGIASENQSGANLMMGAQITTLKLKDLEDIKKIKNIKDGYGSILSQEPVSRDGEIKRTMVMAVSASFIEIDKTGINSGRFFTNAEDKSLSEVVVLGSKIKEKLFGENNPIGKTIKIRNQNFKIIGIMNSRGAVMTIDFDEFVYIPIRTIQKRILGTDYIDSMIHSVYNISSVNETADEMRFVLRQNQNIAEPKEKSTGIWDTGKDDFRVMPMTEIMKVWGEITSALTILLLAIVTISLIVGGVGITNVMYVIVTERTPEIGLRKAVGAKEKDIMWQFLVESILITFIGGIIGVIFGILISILISVVANSYGFDWTFSVPLKAFITALIFSIVFGVLFGLYPARRASKMDPIRALKVE